jgi:hypothetical protein
MLDILDNVAFFITFSLFAAIGFVSALSILRIFYLIFKRCRARYRVWRIIKTFEKWGRK